MPKESQLWDRNYRAPDKPLPPGSWDCHFHVFGSADEYAQLANRSYSPYAMTMQQYLGEIRAQHQALGIEHGLLAHPAAVYGTRNESTAHALTVLGSAYRASAMIDMSFSGADFQRMGQQGFNSVRVNLSAPGNIGIRGVTALRDDLDTAGWHVEFAHGNGIHEMEREVRALGLDVVLEHHGFIHPSQGLDDPAVTAMRRLLADGLIYVKLSAPFRVSRQGPPYADMDPVAAAFIADNPERIVWGSDWPYIAIPGQMPRAEELLNRLRDIAGEANFHKMMVENPSRLHRM